MIWFRKDIIGRPEMVTIFGYIHERIDKKFTKEYYDSLGKKVPTGHSSEDIVGNYKLAKANHPFLYKLERWTFSIDCRIGWFFDAFKKPKHWLRNVKDQTHVIPTGLKKGGWHDSRERLLHGVFSLVEFYLFHENKRGFDWFLDTVNGTETDDPIPEPQREHFQKLVDAHNWWTIEKKNLENDIEGFYNEVKRSDNPDRHIGMWEDFNSNREENKVIYQKINDAEAKISEGNRKHMKIVVDMYEELWS